MVKFLGGDILIAISGGVEPEAWVVEFDHNLGDSPFSQGVGLFLLHRHKLALEHLQLIVVHCDNWESKRVDFNYYLRKIGRNGPGKNNRTTN